MRVALFTDGIYPIVMGGMQRHSLYLAKALAGEGVQVDLYHAADKKNAERAPQQFTTTELQHIRFFPVKFPDLGKTPGHYIRESYLYSKELFKRMQEHSAPDFIYCKGFTGWELLHQKSLGKQFPPIAVNMHGYEIFQSAASWIERIKQKWLLDKPARYQLDHADIVISYGGRVTDVLKSIPVAASKIEEIPGGITADWLRTDITPRNEVLRFIFVGRDERRKGLEELYEAIKSAKSDFYQLHIVGPINPSNRVKLPNVTYHGSITDNHALLKLLDSCQVLVCPSISEGMPNVILEGMSRGLAVLATDTGATQLMVDDRNGILVKPGNVAQLAEGWNRMMNMDAASLSRLQQQSVVKVQEQFLWSRLADETIKMIERRIAQHDKSSI
jgi:glycosyltransferase involved in cell wall biosynthesis